ncbi:MAG: hypothetical protein KatS3mg020_1186 [Fimbriimonadales bacterium]|nr:MAG: hypothetical protein KatS3mg020_1186 [Fimbriimonadales bacterium]
MKTVRRLWAMGLLVGTLGWSLAQTPTLILTNGDVNGDSTIDDADLLAVLFVMGQSCPSGCPEDLNGDGSVDDADLLITMFNQGQQGASASGVFRVSLTVRLGDWSGADQSVKVQVKPVGSENDPNVPIYEYTFSVGGSDTQVELTNLPVGVYTVRAFPADAGRWLRTEQSEPLAVPDGGGIPAVHVPAPAWAQEVIPADSVPAAGLGGGPSRAHRVNLASGVYEHTPEPDLVVINPVGPEVRFARFYSTHLARQGYASAGLPVGWIHSYDLRLEGDLNRLTSAISQRSRGNSYSTTGGDKLVFRTTCRGAVSWDWGAQSSSGALGACKAPFPRRFRVGVRVCQWSAVSAHASVRTWQHLYGHQHAATQLGTVFEARV